MKASNLIFVLFFLITVHQEKPISSWRAGASVSNLALCRLLLLTRRAVATVCARKFSELLRRFIGIRSNANLTEFCAGSKQVSLGSIAF